MSIPYSYFTKRSQMTAVLKADTHRVRTNKPKMFSTKQIPITSMDDDGKVTTIGYRTAGTATPMSPRKRQAIAWSR